MTAVTSPCIAVCQLDAKQRYCTGCGRCTDEIARWGHTDPEDQRQIIARATARLSSLEEEKNQSSSTSSQENRTP
ncbi:MAG TPA: DUF1289 domain-containing protein [Gammaproteobacteria bacterium]|nr:DUF1289 domain-containing protein [Gammaproteobacteria bacterium]